jgi:hypothetical protein
MNKIKIPEGYTLPEDTAEGDTIEELVTLRVEGDMLVPTMIAGVEIASEEMEDEAEDMEEDEMEAEGPAMGGMGERIMGMA